MVVYITYYHPTFPTVQNVRYDTQFGLICRPIQWLDFDYWQSVILSQISSKFNTFLLLYLQLVDQSPYSLFINVPTIIPSLPSST